MLHDIFNIYYNIFYYIRIKMLIKELNELKKISKNGIINFNDNGINQFPLANMNNYLTKIMKGWYFFHNPDGNGRTARFLMNNILSSAGYPWITVSYQNRDKYFSSLENACYSDNILDFANFILNNYKLENKINKKIF